MKYVSSVQIVHLKCWEVLLNNSAKQHKVIVSWILLQAAASLLNKLAKTRWKEVIDVNEYKRVAKFRLLAPYDPDFLYLSILFLTHDSLSLICLYLNKTSN
jgi:hypothetical protein